MNFPCIIFEDEDLLVIHKPAGINTHQSSPEAPWGIHEFLLNHRKDPSGLGIHQRLDRETSGVMVFAKSLVANRSLSTQFENHSISKTYHFVTAGQNRTSRFTAKEPIEGKPSETRFRFLETLPSGDLWEAVPVTGRTHQIRIHAKRHGLVIVGDDAQGPLLLHAHRLELEHPATGQRQAWEASLPDYFEETSSDRRIALAAQGLRKRLMDETETNAFRMIHREADRFPSATIDRIANFLYIEEFQNLPVRSDDFWIKLLLGLGVNPIEGIIRCKVPLGDRREVKEVIWGKPPPSGLSVLENRVRFEIDLLAPGGIGLFLDQRENRLRTQTLAVGKRVLNLFAYTCGFSVSAALAGATSVTSVDLSRKALDWGKRNFELNRLDSSGHRFWTEDSRDVIRRLTARKEKFGLLVLDPPSFSRSKTGGPFSIKKDLSKLIQSMVPLTESEGWLLISSNLTEWSWEGFESAVIRGLSAGGGRVAEKKYGPQPFDFPVTTSCPAYLRTLWIKLK